MVVKEMTHDAVLKERLTMINMQQQRVKEGVIEYSNRNKIVTTLVVIQ